MGNIICGIYHHPWQPMNKKWSKLLFPMCKPWPNPKGMNPQGRPRIKNWKIKKKPIHKKIQVCKHCHSKWKTKTTCATIWRANDQHHNMEKIQVHWQTIQDNWRMPCWRPQFRCCYTAQFLLFHCPLHFHIAYIQKPVWCLDFSYIIYFLHKMLDVGKVDCVSFFFHEWNK